MGVGSGEPGDIRKQLRRGKDVEPGIDLANLLLRWAGGFFFDDGADFRTCADPFRRSGDIR